MKLMKLLLKVTVSGLVLLIGVGATLIVGETTGLALTDLSNAPVEAVVKATNEDALYVSLDGQTGGIYRSEDDGRSWDKLSTNLAADISAIAIHPARNGMIFAGTTGGTIDANSASIWYSEDEGRTWDEYGFALPANSQGELPSVSALTADPNHPGVLYVGTDGAGLYRVQAGGYSRIGGASLHNLYVKDVIAIPDSPIYAISTEGLIAIEGDAWRKIENLPDGVVSLTVDPSDAQTLYMGTVGYGIHRSIDGGQSWHAINNGLGLQPGLILRVPAIAVDENNPRHLVLATAFGVGSQLVGDGIYESFDAGQNWVKLGETSELVNRLTIEDGTIYAATAKGLVQYGASPLPASPISWSRLDTLTNPTIMQSLILILTIAVAQLILVGRLKWIPQRA